MRSSVWSRRAGMAGLILVLGALGLTASAAAGGIAKDLDQQVDANPNSAQLDRVIVQFTQKGVDTKGLAKLFGAKLVADHALINGATFVLPQSVIKKLSRYPSVAWISGDRPLGAQWDCDAESVGADQVWSNPGWRGGGIRVAVLDTGIYSGCADWNRWDSSSSRLVAWKDFVNNQTAPYDDNGHGTHVAGIVMGSGNRSPLNDSRGRFNGVAPNADLVGVKVLDRNGAGLVSTVISGLDWCVQNKDVYNIRVINLSLGHVPRESYTTDPLCAAVRRAVQAGLVVVCAAGNLGKNSLGQTVYGGIICPANEPTALTVGAFNTRETVDPSDDTVCTYSSRARPT